MRLFPSNEAVLTAFQFFKLIRIEAFQCIECPTKAKLIGVTTLLFCLVSVQHMLCYITRIASKRQF